MVHTAINIPAQSFYPTRWTWATVFEKVPFVIFYCSSSEGRGPRCAGWFQDTLNEAGKDGSEAVVLAGGIRKWSKTQKDLTDSILHFPG
jgi:arsenical-resistance protein 2